MIPIDVNLALHRVDQHVIKPFFERLLKKRGGSRRVEEKKFFREEPTFDPVRWDKRQEVRRGLAQVYGNLTQCLTHYDAGKV